MSHTLPDWFIDKWSDEAKLRAQQKKSALHQYCSNAGVFIGDHMYIPRIGQVEAVRGRRLQQLAATTPPMDWVSLLAEPAFLPMIIWDPDKNKLTIPVVQKMVAACMAGIERSQDGMARDAMNKAVVTGVQGVRGPSLDASAAPANEIATTIGDYNTVADLDALAQALTVMGGNFSVEGEDLTYVTPFKLNVNMSLDYLMANKDINIEWLKRLKFTTYEYLYDQAGLPFNAASTGADCYLFAKSAVTSAYNDDVKEINERLGSFMADMFGQWYQGGAIVEEPKGIVRVKTKTNFTVSRRAMPIDNIEV